MPGKVFVITGATSGIGKALAVDLAKTGETIYETIDVLINNASVYKRKRVVTIDGFEEMFAANHLGPFLLTNLILEKLQAAVAKNGSARILNITAPSTTP